MTATTSGTARVLSVYLDASSAAKQVVVGIYTNSASGHPGNLLTQATIAHPIAGAWNVATLPSTIALTQGQPYWIAVLGPTGTGTVQFRDRTASGTSETSRQTTLTSLPATWATGTIYDNAPLSAYAI
jgi:hypothetical protein